MYKLFVAFMFLPIIEIASFIAIGSKIGIFTTIIIIIMSGFLGIFVIRVSLRDLVAEQQQDINFVRVVNRKPIITLIAGLLLLIPGFLTDICGILFLFPAINMRMAKYLKKISKKFK